MASRRNRRNGNNRRFLLELQAMGERVVAAAKEVIRRGAEAVVVDAKSHCPVRTGALRDSLKAEREASGASYKVSSLWYGRIVELSPRSNPFLFPALDENRNRIRADMEAAIRQALRRR